MACLYPLIPTLQKYRKVGILPKTRNTYASPLADTKLLQVPMVRLPSFCCKACICSRYSKACCHPEDDTRTFHVMMLLGRSQECDGSAMVIESWMIYHQISYHSNIGIEYQQQLMTLKNISSSVGRIVMKFPIHGKYKVFQSINQLRVLRGICITRKRSSNRRKFRSETSANMDR